MKSELNKVSKELKVIEMEDNDSFVIKHEKETITIYDESLIEEIIERKFQDKYKKLLYIIMDINNSEDSTESDTDLVREQIQELEAMLIKKYGKYLKEGTLNRYLKMLLILNSKLEPPKVRRGR